MSEQHHPAPTDASALELRVHTGVHAGASEPLTQGSCTIGTAPDCDVVLCDARLAPLQAHLQDTGQGWFLQADSAEAADVPMVPGKLYPLGPLWFSINRPDAPWPPEDEVLRLSKRPAPAGPETLDTANAPEQLTAADAAASGADDEPAPGAEDDTPSPPGSELDHPTRAQSPTGTEASMLFGGRSGIAGVRPALLGGLVALLLGTMTWTFWPPAPSAIDLASLAQAAPGTPASAGQLDAIRQIIGSLGLARQVSMEAGPGGLPLVKATLISDQDYETLAMALSNLNPRPALVVSTEQEIGSQVRELLALQASELKATLESRYLGEGKFEISGKLATPEQREALLSTLKAGLPPVVQLTSTLSVPQERAQAMLAELEATGLAQIRSQWVEGRMDMAIELMKADVPRWEQVLALSARKFDVPFTARVSLRPERQLPDVLAQLPFKVQAVVSGDTPYVVLGDGNKLLLQGQSQGWRLVSIDPDSVVFEGHKAKQVVLQR